ncbi:MAG: PP2C family protein-serine/threonine phosphatase, partial [Candidatus Omnitrophica bacterium]|nr:PP2C family protein-serine/threonine phosphatase [Candidatus Omnitrophota bacterium]
EIARGIQQSFLPAACPEIEGFEIAAVNLPARMVGGDFYDFIPIEKDKWGLVIADVSGKGVPAALFMALSRTLVRASASVTLSPDQALNRANDLILQDAKTNMFVTLFYAVLDAKMRTLKYANAGHNPALHVRGGASDIVLLKAQTMPLGIMSDIRARTEEIALQKGDVILLYTDGVTEAVNENKAWFDMERLETLTRNNRHLSAQVIIRKVQDEVADFVGNQPQFDDITLMVIKAV